MSETTGGTGSVEELEAAVLGSLDLYFEAIRREVEKSKQWAGSGFERYEEARRQLAQVEEELEELRRATAQVQAEIVAAATRGSETSELEKEVSKLQEEVHGLAEAETVAQRRRAELEETVRRSELNLNGDPGEILDRVAAIALHKAEELDAFKGQVDQRFVEGRTSVLGAAS
jgi:predicted  nucleic acid-binding Zn-ribbon protein